MTECAIVQSAANRVGDRPTKSEALERLTAMVDQLDGERRRGERRSIDRPTADRRS